MKSNCLFYAVGQWLKHGGYILMRRSHFAEEFNVTSRWHPAWYIPHFLHRTKAHEVTQFTADPKFSEMPNTPSKFKAWLMLWWFEGKIIGDDKPKEKT